MDYDERRKLEADAGAPTEAVRTWQPAKARQREIEAALRRAKIKMEKPLGKTDLFHRYAFPVSESTDSDPFGRVIYRILSGPAHGRQWAIIANNDMELVDESPARYGSRLARVTARSDIMVLATEIAVRAFGRALDDVERYATARPVSRRYAAAWHTPTVGAQLTPGILGADRGRRAPAILRLA